eukprot:14765858-Alexandrium_andersonii.AAC.1
MQHESAFDDDAVPVGRVLPTSIRATTSRTIDEAVVPAAEDRCALKQPLEALSGALRRCPTPFGAFQ